MATCLARVSAFLAFALAGCATLDVDRHESVTPAGDDGLDSPLRYVLYLPPDYDDPDAAPDGWPAIFALHGIAQVGRNLGKVAEFGVGKQIEEGRDFPFVVISPQIANVAWSTERVIALIEYGLDRYRIDPGRVYLTGTSLGGAAVWNVAAARPDLFAAIAPSRRGERKRKRGRRPGYPPGCSTAAMT